MISEQDSVFSVAVLDDESPICAAVRLGYGRVFTSEFLEMCRADFRLSQREAEVAVLMCKGVPVERVAAHFKVASSTIATHRSNIYRKLRVVGSEQAICKLLLARVGRLEA